MCLYLIKHRILMTSVLSADETPRTDKAKVYRHKVTSRDTLLII